MRNTCENILVKLIQVRNVACSVCILDFLFGFKQFQIMIFIFLFNLFIAGINDAHNCWLAVFRITCIIVSADAPLVTLGVSGV